MHPSTVERDMTENGWSFWSRVYEQPELRRAVDAGARAAGQCNVRQAICEVRAVCAHA
jgi:hypothetical protein